jgi:hypothetical protein
MAPFQQTVMAIKTEPLVSVTSSFGLKLAMVVALSQQKIFSEIIFFSNSKLDLNMLKKLKKNLLNIFRYNFELQKKIHSIFLVGQCHRHGQLKSKT